MKELFDKFLMYFCFAGIGSIAVFAFVRVTLNKWKMKNVKCKIRKFILHSPFYILHFLIPILCVAGMILYGSTKNNSPTNDPPAQTQMVSQPSLCGEMQVEKIVVDVPGARPLQSAGVATTQSLELNDTQPTNSLVRVEKWWRRGAYNDGQVLTFDEDWCFPYGTNHLTSVEVWASGAVYPSMKNPTPIASLVTKLSLAPHDTEVFMGRTTNNTYRIEWHNGHPNRDLNQTADASIELFRNGNIIVTEGGVETEVPYVVPFEHIGFGQNDDWVRANFTQLQALSPSLTNAEEIISIGYANWVDQQVGVGLTNGLYKFSAEFLEDPPEPTELYIGDYSVCVTNAGVYSFVLEKGEEYEFGTWPFNDDIDYWAQDDLAADAPMLTAWWGGREKPGEWTIDGGWNWFWRPDLSEWGYQYGYSCMMPTLQGSPAVTHLGPDDFPITFDAILSDVPQSCDVEYEWTADSECFDIAAPNAKTTQVSAKALPRWNETSMSVSARFKGKSLTSTTAPFTYGTNAVPSVSISLDYPSVTFLNDDKRADRIYRLTAVLQSDSVTNGSFTIAHSGDDRPLISTSTNFTNAKLSFSYDFNLTKNCKAFTNVFYVMSRDTKRGSFTFACALTNGTTLVSRRDYNVVEPLCRLITTDKADNGRFLNPSRLVYGTNTWLGVDVRGDFPPSQVQWAITPGTCRYLRREGYRILIEPTVTSGVAVVKAKFNSDDHQPTFTLPIVVPRTIPVKAFIVSGPKGGMVTTSTRVREQVAKANEIFDQVGIKFDLSFIGQIMSTNFCTLAKYDLAPDGTTNQTLSAQSIALLNAYTNRDCIEVYYVSQIINSKAAAFCCNKGIVMSSKGSVYSLAHELGHALGASDCYARTDESVSVSRWFGTVLPRKTNFGSAVRDWGGSAEGRGFCAKADRHASFLNKCLMNGFDGYHQADIPDGSVLSLKKEARSNVDRWLAPVGAISFEGKTNEEVYSR